MAREFPFEAEHAPGHELAELAAKVKAKGRRTERALDRLCAADPDLYAVVRDHILLSCDEYTVALWTDYLDDNAATLARRKADASVAEDVRLAFAAIEVVAALRPAAREAVYAGGHSSYHHGALNLMSLYRWSLRSARGKPVSAETRRALVLAVWIRGRADGEDHSLDTEAVVNLWMNRDDLAFLAENFDAAMEHRDALREHRSIDRSVVASIIGNVSPVLDAGVL